MENNKRDRSNNDLLLFEKERIDKERTDKEKIDKEKKDKYNKKYIEMAKCFSELSYAKRKKVGAVIVKDNTIISDGYNGTPTGFENECEDSEGNTKWYTLHAEANAIMKLCKIGGASSSGSTLYLTLSPCRECAKLILQAGIISVKYLEDYRDSSGLEFLLRAGINVEKIKN